jgi:hypothetical protein
LDRNTNNNIIISETSCKTRGGFKEQINSLLLEKPAAGENFFEQGLKIRVEG